TYFLVLASSKEFLLSSGTYFLVSASSRKFLLSSGIYFLVSASSKDFLRLCPYNCVKEKSHSHPHDTIILDQQNFVGGNENDSTQFYLKLRRTKRTNY